MKRITLAGGLSAALCLAASLPAFAADAAKPKMTSAMSKAASDHCKNKGMLLSKATPLEGNKVEVVCTTDRISGETSFKSDIPDGAVVVQEGSSSSATYQYTVAPVLAAAVILTVLGGNDSTSGTE